MPYLPAIYEAFQRDYPEIGQAFDALATTVHELGRLDARTRRLVKLGIAVGAQSEGAVRSHVRQALAEGVSRAEIEQVILLSLTTAGLPTMIAALQWSRAVTAAEGSGDGSPR